MVEIGGLPILWHILKMYSMHGVRDFVVCCGYKGYGIKKYFANYFLHMSDITFDLSNNRVEVHQLNAELWRVTLVDTGELTNSGGRLKRVSQYLMDEECFCFTYGDGLADIDITKQLEFHRAHGKLATVMAVQEAGRFGAVTLNENTVEGFIEKPQGEGWFSAGVFVLHPSVIELINDDDTIWEAEPLDHLATDGQLMALPHRGFWQLMDTKRQEPS